MPYYNAIIKLAAEQNILSCKEANLLNDAYIQDIPEYEHFLNQIILLQSSSNYIYDFHQTDFPKLFPILQKNDGIPSPVQEEGAAFVLTPLEFTNLASKIIPDNKLILLHVPDHATFLMRIGNEYLLYDINNQEKLLFTDVPEIMVCMLSKHHIQLKIDELKKDFLKNFHAMFMLQTQIKQINQLQNTILNEKNSKERIAIIENNLKYFLNFWVFQCPSIHIQIRSR